MSNLIDSALLQAYSDGAFGLSTAYENYKFDPVPGTPWAEVFVVQSQPSVNTLGSNGQDLIPGFLQINLNYPVGDGAGTAKAMANTIREYFHAGRRFTYSGQEVFITSAGRGPARNTDSWFQVVVTIYFEARVTRP